MVSDRFIFFSLYQVHQCSVQPEGGAGSASLHLLGWTRRSRTRPKMKTTTGCLGFLTSVGLWGDFRAGILDSEANGAGKQTTEDNLSFPRNRLSSLTHAALGE